MKKTMELSDEEVVLIDKLRAEEIQKRNAAVQSAADLEKQFESCLSVAHGIIRTHIDNAKKELKLAEQVSEKYGVPFRSEIVDVTSRYARCYTPVSFRDKWVILLDKTPMNY